jgi:molybdopterin-synthase adenylyltransferase
MHRCINEVLCAREVLALFRNPRYRDNLEVANAIALEGEVLIAGREVTLQLVLDSSFPLTLPRFFVCPWDALGFIPHIDQHGFVCFADPEGLVLDRQRPVQVVQEAFQCVVKVLTDGVTGKNGSDFVDEFDSYWGKLTGIIKIPALLDTGDDIIQIIIATNKRKQQYIAGSENDISAFRNGIDVSGTFTLQNAVYLPLEPGTSIIPPRPGGACWTVREARDALLSNVSALNLKQLSKLLKKYKHANEYVIVKLPRPSGGTTLFGIRYDRVGERHPLLKGGTAERLVPLQLQRWDQEYLVRRGGGNTSLSAKRVILAGCGAVGGHLAFELVRSGILNLMLVDSDTLIEENSFRHALGRRYWYRKKVEALKEEIEMQLPYVQVTAIASTIEKAIEGGTIDLANYDLLVLALGNPTVELAMNERVHTMQKSPAAIFTWLEPLGIGGHALLVGNALEGGCFECLYSSPSSGERTLENRAAFAAPGQTFGRALTGCGSLYTPYASIDAVRTAVLAAKLVVDVLTGREVGNPLLSWN